MKQILLVFCLLFSTAVFAQEPQVVSGLIIQFKENPQAITDFEKQIYDLTGHEIKFNRDLALQNFRLFNLPLQLPEEVVKEIIKALEQLPGVVTVEKDQYLKHTLTPDDVRYFEQWHYFEDVGGMNADEAWDTHTGAGTVVAVIDTGYVAHSDLNDNIVGGYDFISDSANANDGNGRDSNYNDPGDWTSYFTCGFFAWPTSSSWHGTHVAGTIAAETDNNMGVAGVAHDAKILVVRVLGRCGGTFSDIIDGIVWASGGNVAGVPANANPADVINMSLGGSGSCGASIQAAINTAIGNGTTVVTAAGNGNANMSNHVPSNCNNVIAVASNDREGNRSYYSNFGSSVDVTAPGGETNSITSNGVLSTLNTGSQSPGSETYAFYQGTSMAAPHVAGAAAILKEADPSLTPAQIEQLLKDTARALPGSCSGGCGAGIIDLRAALDDLGPPPPNEAPTANFTFVVDDLSAHFTDTSTDNDGTIVAWDWDFGTGGNVSTQQNPTMNYDVASTYNVCLIVTDDDGDDSAQVCKNVETTEPTPNVKPVSNFTFGCTDLGCNFTDTSTDNDGTIVGWDWDFDDGDSSSSQNPSHTYPSANTYQVCLIVTDDDGADSDAVCKGVTVVEPTNEAPTANFNFNDNQLDVNFTDTSTDSDGNIVSWDWDFGDSGSSSSENPSHTYAAEGTYTVMLTVTDDDGATDSISKSVSVTECSFFFFGRCWF